MTPEDTGCLRFRVSGRVQGVFYRASTEAQARELGLTGWVRNESNGDVMLVACGPAPALQKLEKWLWQGPPNARVQAVTRIPVAFQMFTGFEVRR